MQLISSLNLAQVEYLSRDRFISYHHQLRLILSLGAKVQNILEIGIYNSIFTEIVKQAGYQVQTADIDPNLHPDFILDLTTDFSLPQDKFDAIALFQVLEHLPYEEAEKALKKLAAATKKYLVISIPYNCQFLGIQFKFSYTKRSRYLLFHVPKFWSKKPICDQHFWEMGLKEYPKERIINSIEKAGLKIKQQFRDQTHPYHQFFVLEKQDL
jgi:hypothetical protein